MPRLDHLPLCASLDAATMAGGTRPRWFWLTPLAAVALWIYWWRRRYLKWLRFPPRRLRNRAPHPEGCRRVRLSRGECLYKLSSPRDGRSGRASGKPLVVLVHGFTGCHMDMAKIYSALVERNCRVLSFDNYGRGWSDLASGNPKVLPELFAGQLAELLYALGETQPFHLLGYSMGGGIACAFAGAYGPERVLSLTLIAPAGLPSMGDNLQARFAQPVFRFLDMLVPMGRQVLLSIALSLLKSTYRSKDPISDFVSPRERMPNEPGLPHAFVDTVKHYPFHGLKEHFQRVAATGIPTLAIWGADDQVVPPRGLGELRAIYAGAKNENITRGTLSTVVLAGHTHMVAWEAATTIVNRMLSGHVAVVT